MGFPESLTGSCHPCRWLLSAPSADGARLTLSSVDLSGDVPGFLPFPAGFLINLLLLAPLCSAVLPVLFLGLALGTHLSLSRSVSVCDLNVGTMHHPEKEGFTKRLSPHLFRALLCHLLLPPPLPQSFRISS